MSRWSHYDTDEERLPEGMTRIGYDSDTQTYTFQDSDGSLWESAPGNQYGQLTRVGHAPIADEENDSAPFLAHEYEHSRSSWRAEMMPLLNFGLLVGLCLLLLFWYLHVAAQPSTEKDNTAPVSQPGLVCQETHSPYSVKKGDSCWDLARERAITVDDIIELNPKLDCEKLPAGEKICLPEIPASG